MDYKPASEDRVNEHLFAIDLERSRVYWEYYRSMFLVFSMVLAAAMVCVTLIYTKGGLTLVPTVGIILLLFLCVILLSALMSLTIWRHENKHLDELAAVEVGEAEKPVSGQPLV